MLLKTATSLCYATPAGKETIKPAERMESNHADY